MPEGAAAELLGLVCPRREAGGRWAGRGEGNDFLAVWSGCCPQVACPPGIKALLCGYCTLVSLGSCGVSGGLRGRGRFPRWESCWMSSPVCSRVSGEVSGPCAGIVAAGGDTLPGLGSAGAAGLGSAHPQPHSVEFAGLKLVDLC